MDSLCRSNLTNYEHFVIGKTPFNLLLSLHSKENCENVKTLDMFDRANWSCLAEAINTITTNNKVDEQGAEPVKYGLKNNIYYLLMT